MEINETTLQRAEQLLSEPLRHFYSVTYDRRRRIMRVREVCSDEVLFESLSEDDWFVADPTFRFIILRRVGESVSLWSVQENRFICPFPDTYSKQFIFSPDGTKIAMKTRDISVFDIVGDPICRIELAMDKETTYFAFAADGASIFVANWDYATRQSTITQYDAYSGALLASPPICLTWKVSSILDFGMTMLIITEDNFTRKTKFVHWSLVEQKSLRGAVVDGQCTDLTAVGGGATDQQRVLGLINGQFFSLDLVTFKMKKIKLDLNKATLLQIRSFAYNKDRDTIAVLCRVECLRYDRYGFLLNRRHYMEPADEDIEWRLLALETSACAGASSSASFGHLASVKLEGEATIHFALGQQQDCMMLK